MKNRPVKAILGIILILIGFILFAVNGGDDDFSMAVALTSIMILGIGVILFWDTVRGNRKTFFTKTIDGLLGATDFEAPADQNALERSLTGFRSHYRSFFADNAPEENPAIQSDCTQLFASMLSLQKARLRRMGITLEFAARRMAYGNGRNVKAEKYFDGKYEISEVSEDIDAVRCYRVNGRTIFTKYNTEAARYTIINAKKTGDDNIICPHCGSAQTRESLLDGCDFCGTKFTVEDLGEKISAFALRDDYALQYAKFANKRQERFSKAYFNITAIFTVFWLIAMVILAIDEGGFSFDLTLPLYLFGMAAVSVCFGMILGFPFALIYFFIIVPIREASAAFKRYSQEKLEQMKAADKRDKNTEKTVREFDPLFSINAFYSNVQNKLATVFFADTINQINAFADMDLSRHLERFANVFDFEAEDIDLQSYKVENGLQVADIKASLNLFEAQNAKACEKKTVIRMQLIKDADCKTQAVCAPFVMTCPSCGASLSLEHGLVCEYCDSKADLKHYDWSIRAFEVVG